MSYNFTVWFAIITECIFLIGEIPIAGFLYKNDLSMDILFHPIFWFFILTHVLGLSGLFYIFSEIQLGLVAALMGAFSLVIKNILGYYLLGQPPLSLSGYIAIGLICISLILLAK